ncbi:restriction endonuclease subunit S [Acinetobacter vivianii]|uniref:restriction endonuclease subunit S n=1 Tax=Acinetobacter vivianii TaxID=1776742 RepID=UPI00190395FA|nr:restriction endonuclease subunit S [Acinetobacter vivianii]MBJ8482959.1 restriction endonuclease subunit S [Acinetobacter vivianii]
MSNDQLTKSDKVKNVPKLRFTEFQSNSAWEYKPLKKILSIGSGKDYKHLKSGNIPVYGTGGYMLSVDDFLYQGDSVCIGRKGTIDKPMFVTGKFWTVDTLFYTHSFQNALPKYVFHYFETINWRKHNEASGVPSLSKETILNINISIPDQAEQQKIAACLSSIDKLIQCELTKLETYKQHKNGLLQHLFTENGESLPSLRFDEFSEEWENIELSKIAKPVKKKNTDQDKILVLSLSNEYGLVSQVDYFKKKIAGENTDKYIVLQKNDFVYNDRITKSSTYGTIKRLSLYEEGIVSPIYKCFRFEKNQNPVFWEYFFESKSHENEIRQIINEGARAGRYNISTDSFLSINVMLPSHLEQEKIASCLTSLDETITSQNNYIECLKEHKKGLMQQLFPVFEDVSA